ncbi:hypothetical protein CVU4313_08070 [Campylobacter vulpis]|uniref:Uncharacterized protein n=1 Tax=Campylobacter vulpis TaxID=1655500 RepID=A0A2G4QZX8_9BACT|nr:hypothetical protein [Campylobacter vulpis]MBS4253260.1 hypothetical protein [Campylobacter vulpis]MBS4282465.1 hypothetical protein [Campylobacter vulpis]PHY89840.1 hypothetical protein AA994_06750 [Campylobacter vulpis]
MGLSLVCAANAVGVERRSDKDRILIDMSEILVLKHHIKVVKLMELEPYKRMGSLEYLVLQ